MISSQAWQAVAVSKANNTALLLPSLYSNTQSCQSARCRQSLQSNKYTQSRSRLWCFAAGSAALGGISSAINVFTFEDATLERAGLLQSHQSQTVPPFLVVASNDVNQVGNVNKYREDCIYYCKW